MKILGLLIFFALSVPGWAWQSPAPTPVPAWHTLHTGPIMGKGGYALAGPVNAIVTDPIDPQTFYAGTLGGVWKTIDGGANWQPLTDDALIDSVLSLALDPNNSQVIWAGLGHQNFEYENSTNTDLLKSSDGGATWSPVRLQVYPDGNDITTVATVAVQPGDSNVVLASVTSGFAGIYRTVDGGNSWTRVSDCDLAHHLFFDPANGQIAFATCQFQGAPDPVLVRSFDSGLTWNPISAGIGIFTDDVSAGISPDGTVLYFSDASDNTISTWRSFDLGTTWQQTQKNGPRQDCFGQSHVLLISPGDNNTLLRGCDSVYLSRDGGATWNHIGADLETWQNALAFAADGTLITGNNHGIWKTASLTGSPMSLPFPYTLYDFPTYPAQQLPWQDLNATLDNEALRQQFAVDPLGSGKLMGTSFFNGTIEYRQGVAEQTRPGIGNASVFGADGTGYSFIYYDWGKWWSRQVSERFNLWQSPASQVPQIWNALASYPGAGGWTETPFVASSSSPHVLLTGYSGTNGIPNISADAGQTWRPVQVPTAFFTISSIAIDVNDANGMWLLGDVVGGHDVIDISQNGLDAHPTWVTCPVPGLNRLIKTDPSADGSAWIAGEAQPGVGASFIRSPSLLHVKDHCAGGIEDVAKGQLSQLLPNAALFDVAIDPAYPQDLYVASQAGVYASFDGGTTWSAFTTGMPNTVVSGLQIDTVNRVLYAATAGRGMWATQLPPSPANISVTPTALNFPDTLIGRSAGLAITLSNTGGIDGSVQVGAATGDFTASSACGTTVQEKGSCTVNVTFSPTAGGKRNGSLPIIAQGKETLVALNGNGLTPATAAPLAPDFSLSANQTQMQVGVGQAANASLGLNALNGFKGAVTFSCAGLPANATCSFSPSRADMSASAAVNVMLTISPVQTAKSQSPFRSVPLLAAACLWFALPRKKKLLLASTAATCLLVIAGCRGLGPNPPILVQHSYVATITGTSGPLQHAIAMNVSIETSEKPK